MAVKPVPEDYPPHHGVSLHHADDMKKLAAVLHG
jgi:hypothetical protein